MQYLYLGNDHENTVTGVTVDGSPATTGTMTWRLFGASGSSIATGNMANDGSGNFSDTIESSDFSSQAANTVGAIQWVFEQGDYDAQWDDDVTFLKRTPGV